MKPHTPHPGDSTALRTHLLAPGEPSTPRASTSLSGAGRVTILPRVSGRAQALDLSFETRERYETVKPLGTGAMGEVELVRDRDIERAVALKRLKPELQGPTALARFAEEVRAAGSLEHPNIATVYDVGLDTQGRYYFTMKYIEGETLDDILAKLRAGDAAYHHRFPTQRRLEIGLDILRALEFAHAKGILHRDLKPSNIMIGAHGEVSVMDWGIAKRLSTGTELNETAPPAPGDTQVDRPGGMTRDGAMIGTPYYMSPEQASGDSRQIDARSDLYSLGVLLHEWFGLQHYLHGKITLPEILAGIFTVQLPHLNLSRHPHQPLFPAELWHFVRRAMAKSPEERFQSATEMRQQLEEIREGNFRVQCPCTLTRKMSVRVSRLAGSSPLLNLLLLGSAATILTMTVAGWIGRLL